MKKLYYCALVGLKYLGFITLGMFLAMIIHYGCKIEYLFGIAGSLCLSLSEHIAARMSVAIYEDKE